jgi:hypothetical protein
MRPVAAHVSRTLPTADTWHPGWAAALKWYTKAMALEGFGAPPHGHPAHWDWGHTLYTLGIAWERHKRMQALYDQLTPDQRTALWSDTSPVAAELRAFAR